jgi:sulfopyruvate decarboxylase TPP-binding subunit
MIDGADLVVALKGSGVTHVLWIPDSYLGAWEAALRSEPSLKLIRVCRESEAIAIAAGLLLGGKRPIVILQCTGFFDAGDALRNVVHDMKLPLFVVVGVRSYYAHQKEATEDTCPVYAEPIVRAWQVPYVVLDDRHSAADLAAAYRQARTENRAGVVLLAE